ncbi:ATP-binding cassette domain-containing protein [Halomonas sp. ISL-60]|uniref:ABC transporter ATP-binding protein n=1 Tax=unclassified Halomonas TaxID=2609666 RepID=UPI0007D94939|nr:MULTISPECIES: ATP-binding cassette domain-containing protein [unclassified Halomonas]MBT2773570.1 ATP-binding cassette domain-containing protein [Halomonas sp. ISL-60]MBT2788967.1 ATP-binding cassette domain-containing protein [Halomonas sp. ISL-106]MBT2799104.1 ATP-binding cassette domain-containing protein [Halomonas sp. ISL-104]MBT2800922.1 ATP-binding cassette domain-containing protein [Halomonas sp. ISL-56]OAL60257.1 nickel ABC transporter ATP-binding protein [Halomonas sp. ALS9]
MLKAHQLRFQFANSAPLLRALSLTLNAGQWLGLSGDSGAGKSTLGKLLAGYLAPQTGAVTLDGAALPKSGVQPVQWLPQSPELAVNPRWRVGKILREAWTPSDAQCQAFGVQPSWLSRFPQSLSGGELQRVCVLRALAPEVRFLVADEISTMLDPITQLELWQALKREAEQRQLGVLVISHDSALLERLCPQRLHLSDGQLTSI